MCKVGDIILINEYEDNGIKLRRHSFIVVDDDGGIIKGMNYDFIGIVMSSFESEEQRTKKLSYDGNFPIAHDDTETNPHNTKKWIC